MHKKNATWSLVILVLVFVGLAASAVHEFYSKPVEPIIVAPLPTTQIKQTFANPAGTVSLKLGERANFTDLSITPLSIIDDSRCAKGNTCIWAGTVKISLMVVTTSTKTVSLELGKSISAGNSVVSLVSVSPTPVAGSTIDPSQYLFTLNVAPAPTSASAAVPTLTPGQTATTCHIGGCSGEICSDKTGTVSSCIYRAEFACYKKATCEVQPSGQCGWTPSSELSMCIANTSSTPSSEMPQ